MDSVVLHVKYTCLPGKAEEFVRELKVRGLQAAARRDDGCLQYDYFLSCEEADTVLLLEHWRDAAALAAHGAGPLMPEIAACKEGRVIRTQVERFE